MTIFGPVLYLSYNDLRFDRKSGDRRESDAYVEGLKQAGTFNTVEGFYRHYS